MNRSDFIWTVIKLFTKGQRPYIRLINVDGDSFETYRFPAAQRGDRYAGRILMPPDSIWNVIKFYEITSTPCRCQSCLDCANWLVFTNDKGDRLHVRRYRYPHAQIGDRYYASPPNRMEPIQTQVIEVEL